MLARYLRRADTVVRYAIDPAAYPALNNYLRIQTILRGLPELFHGSRDNYDARSDLEYRMPDEALDAHDSDLGSMDVGGLSMFLDRLAEAGHVPHPNRSAGSGYHHDLTQLWADMLALHGSPGQLGRYESSRLGAPYLAHAARHVLGTDLGNPLGMGPEARQLHAAASRLLTDPALSGDSRRRLASSLDTSMSGAPVGLMDLYHLAHGMDADPALRRGSGVGLSPPEAVRQRSRRVLDLIHRQVIAPTTGGV